MVDFSGDPLFSYTFWLCSLDFVRRSAEAAGVWPPPRGLGAVRIRDCVGIVEPKNSGGTPTTRTSALPDSSNS